MGGHHGSPYGGKVVETLRVLGTRLHCAGAVVSGLRRTITVRLGGQGALVGPPGRAGTTTAALCCQERS